MDLLELLELLRCPACAGRLAWERRQRTIPGDEYGFLRCECHAYPLVAGIPILQREGTTEIVAALERENLEEALVVALNTSARSTAEKILEKSRLGRIPGVSAPLRRKYADARLARARNLHATATRGGTFRELLDAAFAYSGNRDAADYFFYKWGQPRFVAALAWTPVLAAVEGPVLDLACGPGHLVWSLAGNGLAGRIVGADLYFKSLFLARRLSGTRARFVCCNAAYGLPFRDGAFGAALSADAFHFLPYQAPCLRELRRSVRNDGLLLLISVPNPEARCPVIRTGTPPALGRWSELLSDLPFRLVSDRTTVARYLHGEGPDAEWSASAAEWPDLALVTVAASRNGDWFSRHGKFTGWPHAAGALGVNPLYRTAGPTADGVALRLQFPSPFFESENGFARTYLPDTAVIPAATASAEALDALVARWVLVGLPSDYGAEISSIGHPAEIPVGRPVTVAAGRQ